MTNYPVCPKKQVARSINPVPGDFLNHWIPGGKNLLRRLVLSPLSLFLWSNHKLFPLVSFFSDQYFYSKTLHLSNSFPALWETLGVMPLPDPAFLEIIRGSITRSLVPLAPSTNRTALHGALVGECSFILASIGHYPGISYLSAVSQSVQQRRSFLWRNKEFLVLGNGCEIKILSVERGICLPQQIASSRALWHRASVQHMLWHHMEGEPVRLVFKGFAKEK